MLKDPPLCVDLDGTLLRTDLLMEAVPVLLKQQPLTLFLLPLWLWLGGKARLKAEVAARVDFSTSDFPVNAEVADYVRMQRKTRETILVTGSHQIFADSVAQNLDLFDRVFASDASVNLTNVRKRDRLVREFGERGFDYIGNDKDDLEVWPYARQALAVSTQGGIAANSAARLDKIFDESGTGLWDYLNLMRVHQWSKNLLVFVPFFLDQNFADLRATLAIVLAFLAMSLLASATYIINDMLDLQADRQNELKSKRALASGQVSLKNGFLTVVALMCCVFLLMFALPVAFNLCLILYLITTLTYSFLLKQYAIVDVLTIASLHTLRVIAGSVAIGAAWSFWLLAFSMFVFFSLALAKRVAELKNLEAQGRLATIGRDYQTTDIPVLLVSGVSTGFLSVLVVALYINSEKVQRLYAEPMVLWMVCPVLMYWIAHIWIKTSRGDMHEDPIVFTLKDNASRLVVLVMALVVAVAMIIP